MTAHNPDTREKLAICERLRRKERRFPATGGGSIGTDADGKTTVTSYVTDAGRRLANPDGPQAAETIDALYEALEPFADFANLNGAAYLPDNHVITLGSGMAARQLTMGDCRKARAALAKARGESGQ